MDATTARSLLGSDCPFYRRTHEIPDDRRRLPRPRAVGLPSRPERCRWSYRATEGAVFGGGRQLVHAADAERRHERLGERRLDRQIYRAEAAREQIASKRRWKRAC